jgi:hypothetical protein
MTVLTVVLHCSVLGLVVTQLATLVCDAVMTQTHRGEAWSTSLPGHPYSCPLYHHRTEMEGESAQLAWVSCYVFERPPPDYDTCLSFTA